MNPFPDCVVVSRDAALQRTLAACVNASVSLRAVDRADRLGELLDEAPHLPLVLDLRQDDAAALIPRCLAEWPRALVIALGPPRSDPVRAAEAAGAYAAEDVAADRLRLQALLRRALDHARLLRERDALRDAPAPAKSPADTILRPAGGRIGWLPLQHFSRAFRHAGDVQSLVDQVVEAIASATLVMRAGLFARLRDGAAFRLRSGLRCLGPVHDLEFADGDPLVRWMSAHAHLISRSTLDYLQTPSERALLKQALDAMGAEVIVPLQGQKRLSGWLFIGHRATGLPFSHEDLEALMILADHVAVILENALLSEDHAVQKTLAETLLHSLPTGIVTADAGGTVRWCNDVAGAILDIAPERVLNQPVSMLGSRLADLIWRGLETDAPPEPCDLADPSGTRHLSAHVRRLSARGQCLGAVALIQDLTRERTLIQQQAALDRRAFWNELAAAMSHEIRNPLVAISTFAQLLPERYADPEFRTEFRSVVEREIERLNNITEQINAFAHPPDPVVHPVDMGDVLRKSLDEARGRDAAFARVPASLDLEPDLPPLTGDGRALQEACTHLVVNALEAASAGPKPRIDLAAAFDAAAGDSGLSIRIRDNGRGIPAEHMAKLFSPFYTTKARGLGLGLAIAQRTVRDHGGRIDVDSGPTGTEVRIRLPAAPAPAGAAGVNALHNGPQPVSCPSQAEPEPGADHR